MSVTSVDGQSSPASLGSTQEPTAGLQDAAPLRQEAGGHGHGAAGGLSVVQQPRHGDLGDQQFR